MSEKEKQNKEKLKALNAERKTVVNRKKELVRAASQYEKLIAKNNKALEKLDMKIIKLTPAAPEAED